jgi:hypothetical protein
MFRDQIRAAKAASKQAKVRILDDRTAEGTSVVNVNPADVKPK